MKVGYGSATYVGHPIRVPARDGSFSPYMERAKIFFQANDVAKAKQLSVFLSVIGRENFALLRDLLAPDGLQGKSLNDVIEVLQQHFEPKLQITAECFHFHRRGQLPTETVAEYMAQLRWLLAKCNFTSMTLFVIVWFAV